MQGTSAAQNDRSSVGLTQLAKQPYWREDRLRAGALLCAAVLGVQSVAMLLGWYGAGPEQLRPAFAGVPFNTVVSFFLITLALAATAMLRLRTARAVAALLLAFAIAILCGYALGWSPGMDAMGELFGSRRELFRDAMLDGSTGALRMAPNAALAFAIVAISLLAINTGRMNRVRLIVGSLGALVATLGGFVGISRTIFGLPTKYLWGDTPAMSFPSALAFIAVGLGTLAVTVLAARRAGVYTGRIVPGVAAATVLIAALFLWVALVDHDRRTLKIVVQHEAVSMAAELNRSVNNCARVVDRLVQRRTITGGDTPSAQGVSSSQVIRDFPGVTALTWLDSAGAVTWRMAESETAEETIGSPFARSASRVELLRAARAAGRAVISPPLMHRDRSATVLMAAPISRSSGSISGYLVVELIPQRLIEETLPEDFDSLYGYELRDHRFTLASRASAEARENNGLAATLGLTIRGRDWNLTVYPTGRTVTDYSSPLPTTFLIAALICAALAARIVRAAQVAEEQSATLARAVHSLDAENEARREAELLRDENAELLQVQAAELAIQYRELQSTTEVLEAQRDELRQAHEFSAALVRSTVDAVVAFDNEGRVNTWNPAMSVLTGWEHDDLGDAHIGTLLPFLGQDQEMRLLQEALAGRATTLNAMRAAHRLWGESIYLDLTVTPMRATDGTVLGGLLVARNVTEQQRVAEVIMASKEAAEAASRAKSDFLARMSHELRTPLNAVIGFTNVILRNSDNSLSKVQITYLDRIRANGKHLLALINTVLDLTKIESGAETVEMAPTSVSILVRQTVSELEVNAAPAGLHLQIISPPAAYATTDPDKLKQVLINLIGNAMKFTPKDGTIIVRVDTDERTGQALRISVEDTGIGIAADRLDAIFEAFEQADSQTAHVYGGTGLGLAISRKLCTLMGHALTAESTLGKGSCLTVSFGQQTN